MLAAPPGAGKTTVVPLALLDGRWLGGGKILVLEPRRLAARAAAERMAQTLGETAGETVGYRTRLQSRIGPRTRIEVITEGVFTRMILDDPGLEGVGAVLFDEFHERSLDADLGLALARDSQAVLRDDLRLLVMSATLDIAGVSRLLDGAPVIEAQGRMFPVETLYLGRNPVERIEDAMARACLTALGEETGIGAGLPAGAGRDPSDGAAADRAAARSGGRCGRPVRRAGQGRRRTAPSSRRRRDGARWCWRPRWPRPA